MKTAAPASTATMPRSFAARRPFVILGKMRRLAEWRQARGMSINVDSWARVIAAELAEVSAANLMRWGRRIGLDTLEADRAREIADAELQRRATHGHHGCHGCPFPATVLGEMLDLVTCERDALKFWLPIAIDETRKAGQRRRKAEKVESEAEIEKRRAKDAARKRADRRAEGRPTQAERSARAEVLRAEIEASGLSKAAFYRRKKAQSETVASAETVASMGELKRGNNRSIQSDTINGDARGVRAPSPFGGEGAVTSSRPPSVSVQDDGRGVMA